MFWFFLKVNALTQSNPFKLKDSNQDYQHLKY